MMQEARERRRARSHDPNRITDVMSHNVSPSKDDLTSILHGREPVLGVLGGGGAMGPISRRTASRARARSKSQGVEEDGCPLSRILLAAWGAQDTELAVRTAIRIANSADCELHLAHVEGLPGYTAYAPVSVRHLEMELRDRVEVDGLEKLWELDRRTRAAGGIVAGARLRVGTVAEEVVGLAEELGADLIVVGTRGRNPIRRALMGSVSESVIHLAHCPVVVVRAQKTDEKGRRGLRFDTFLRGMWAKSGT